MRGLTFGMLKETFARFGADDASTWAAAIAYATVFAIAPLLIIAIAVAGGVLGLTNGGHGHHVIENQLVGAIGGSAGSQTAQMVRSMVDTSFSSHQGSVLAQTIGWATFVLAASGLFLTLQGALNAVWHVKPTGNGMWLTIRNRLASAAMLLAIGILVLATVALNVAMSFLWSHVTAVLSFPGANVVATILNYVIDAAVLALMFALMYKYLPDTEIGWGDVRSGAIATAILFVVGEALLSVYISHAGISNGYGAAGSLVVLLVWVYYSALLLLLGAEFTRVYAEKRGSRA
ncbi:MAG: YihY/virulence factor BrkB family protein, partial [Myxococcales bacterium]|nr:YihY/virulence factor BrkB family protein [Myxococcales bacterium]